MTILSNIIANKLFKFHKIDLNRIFQKKANLYAPRSIHFFDMLLGAYLKGRGYIKTHTTPLKKKRGRTGKTRGGEEPS